MISSSLIRYVLLAARRDKLVLSLLLLMILGSCLSVFLGSAAITEAGLFAIVFTAGSLRALSVVGLVLFVVFYVRRSFDARDVDFLLSRPISRTAYIFSHVIAFSLLAIVTALFALLALYAVGPKSFGMGHLLWGYSLMAELMIMVNVAFFFAMVLPSASTSALATLGFYTLGRIIGQVLGTLAAGAAVTDNVLVHYAMRIIALFMPRLDLLGQTSWLIYGPEGAVGYGFITIQALGFTLLLAMASLYDLTRRQF